MRTYAGIHALVLMAAGIAIASGAAQAKGSKETVLYSFSQSAGASPASLPAEDSKGNLYGTTTGGGASGLGTVFKLTPKGTESVLHSFAGSDGTEPSGNVILAGGDLYGATLSGGANDAGVIFRIARNGKFDVLHSFGASGDAGFPSGWVVWDNAGYVYGAAQGGTYGSARSTRSRRRTGKRRWSIPSPGNRWRLSRELLPSGTLYGETTQGGADDAGVVFKIDTKGDESVLYSFNANDNNGYSPAGPMGNDNSSNLYGTAEFGGTNGVGTAFRVTQGGTFTLLHTFGGAGDGSYPLGLFAGPKAFYGATLQGGNGSGIVYSMQANGAQKALYKFTGGADGGSPQAPPFVDSHKNVYGTTLDGGADAQGVVYELKGKK